MFKYQNSTILLNALYTEVSELAKTVTSAPNVAKASLEGISIPVNKEVSGFTQGTCDTKSRVELSTLLININHDCVSIPCTLEYALQVATETVSVDTDMSVYGMTWASKANPDFRINILHPIVVQALIAGEYSALISLEDVGTLYVFEYKNAAPKKLNDKFAEEVIERWTEILTVIGTEAYTPNTTLKCTSNMESMCKNLREGSSSIETAQISFGESGNNPSKVITPTMFVTHGILFPYYGAIQSRQQGGSYESRDLVHMGSCNLDHRRDIGAWGGTCTGNLQNSVYASLRVLTTLNMGSAHHTDVMAANMDVRTYVKITQEISTEMLLGHFRPLWEVPEEVPSIQPPEDEEGTQEGVEPTIEVSPETEVVVVRKRGRPSKAIKGDM